MVIIGTGTPGTGKTKVARFLSKALRYTYVDVHSLLRSKKLWSSYDNRRKCYVVDKTKLVKMLLKKVKTSEFSTKSVTGELHKKTLTVLKNHSHAKRRMVVFDKSKKVVIDSHLSHYLPKKYVELCIVTHCDIVVLKKRLEKRKYSQLKIRENLDAEIFQTCLTEAQEQRHTILEVDTTKTFDKKKLLTKVKAWIS